MEERVGVRALRQNLSRYLDQVKDGATLVVTERGATPARGNLADFHGRRPSAGSPSSEEILSEQRADRV